MRRQLSLEPRSIRTSRSLLRDLPDAEPGTQRHRGRGEGLSLPWLRPLLPRQLQGGHQVIFLPVFCLFFSSGECDVNRGSAGLFRWSIVLIFIGGNGNNIGILHT
jgi:hypothetical protein